MTRVVGLYSPVDYVLGVLGAKGGARVLSTLLPATCVTNVLEP